MSPRIHRLQSYFIHTGEFIHVFKNTPVQPTRTGATHLCDRYNLEVTQEKFNSIQYGQIHVIDMTSNKTNVETLKKTQNKIVIFRKYDNI